MKKLISMLLVISMLLCFASCNTVSEDDYAALQSELNAKITELQDKNGQIEVLSGEKDDCINRLTQLENELTSLKDKIEKLTNQNEVYSETLSENADKITELEEERDKYKDLYDRKKAYYDFHATYISPYPFEEWIESQKSVPEELPVYVEGTSDRWESYNMPYEKRRDLIMYSDGGGFFETLCEIRGFYCDDVYALYGEVYTSLSNTEPRWLGYWESYEMDMVHAIKYLRITREEFDKVIETMTERGYYEDRREIPNGDILYTFDNEIINHYYRRDADEIITVEEWLEDVKSGDYRIDGGYPEQGENYLDWHYEYDYGTFLKNGAYVLSVMKETDVYKSFYSFAYKKYAEILGYTE